MFNIGDKVILTQLPERYYRGEYCPLTLGRIYIVVSLDGSNVITTSDDPGITQSYNYERVELNKTQ